MAIQNNSACKHRRLERCERGSLLDAAMYRLGFFPWRCPECGKRTYSRTRLPISLPRFPRTAVAHPLTKRA